MLFTVITINYNNENGLRRTIESVIGQSYHDFEYVIIDGGSNDGSVDIIKEFENYITYWVSEKDRGIYHAMNKGVAQAQGDYCIFLNSGDCFYDDTVLERMSTKVVVDDITIGRVFSSTENKFIFSPPERDISLYYLYSATVPHQGSFINTKLLNLYPYDEKLRIVSDWKFYVQTIIERNCSVNYTDEPVVVFDTNGISTSNPEQMWKEKVQVLSEMFPPRILSDYQLMKSSECLTQSITPMLRKHYRIDRTLYYLGILLSKFVKS